MAERLETLVWLALLAAVSANATEALADPNGAGWDALRFALSTVFAVTLAALVAARLHGRAEDRGRGG